MLEPEKHERTHREVMRLLDEIHDPCSVANSTPMGLVEMGLVRSVTISDHGDVAIDLRLTSPFCHMIDYISKEAIAKASELEGVSDVTVVADTGVDWSPSMISPAARRRQDEHLAEMMSARPLPVLPRRPH